MAVCSWGWRGAQVEEIGGKLRKGVFDMLGDGSYFSGDGHEIMVPLPTWDDVKMQMVGNAGTGGCAEIKANIDAVGLEMAAKHGAAAGEHRHEPIVLFRRKFREISQVPAWSHKQMAVGIGKTIEQHNSLVVTIQQ